MAQQETLMQNSAKSSKQAAVDKNQATIFAVVAIASVITVGSIMIAKGLWTQSSYLGRVAGKKEAAVKQLESNKVAVSSLTEAYQQLNNQSPNLLGGTPDGLGPKDGSNSTLILDALPNTYDFPALASSLEKLLFGYNIENIGGSDDSIAQQELGAGSPVEIPFSFGVTTSYDGLKQLIDTFDKSIRPFQIVQLDVEGTNSDLKVNVQAKTYYQPDTGMQITTEAVN